MSISTNMLTLIEVTTEAVKQSLFTFVENGLDNNPDELTGKLVSEVTKGLMKSLKEAGGQGLKAFIEQFETDLEVIEGNGRRYHLSDAASLKKFLSVFGVIELSRRYYYCPDSGADEEQSGERSGPKTKSGASLVPLDERWDMGGQRYATPEVVDCVLESSACLTPGQLSKMMRKMAHFEPSTACIQDIIRRDGEGIASLLEDEDEGIGSRNIKVPEQTEVLVVSFDGANLPLREKGPKRGRPKQRPHSPTQSKATKDHPNKATESSSSKSQSSSYKNAMVGSFSYYEGVEGVINMENREEGIVPHRLSSHYIARMPEDNAIGFKGEFEATLEQIESQLAAAQTTESEAQGEVVKIVLCDGARSFWTYIENNPRFEGYHKLLDFFHAAEHLSALAQALFGPLSDDNQQANLWYKKWRFNLKYEEHAVDGILRSVAYYSKTLRLSKSRRKDIDREAGFFRRNKARMDYPEHVFNGWPIGSGPVEAACKTIVKARQCQSGMRWSRPGGRDILALRVLYQSDQWESVWRHYRETRWAKQPRPQPKQKQKESASDSDLSQIPQSSATLKIA